LKLVTKDVVSEYLNWPVFAALLFVTLENTASQFGLSVSAY